MRAQSKLNSPFRAKYNESKQGVESNGKNSFHNTKTVAAKTSNYCFHQNIPPRNTTGTFEIESQNSNY